MGRFTLPVGYHDIHRTKIVNYQLNRWHSLGYCRLEDLKAAAARMRGAVKSTLHYHKKLHTKLHTAMHPNKIQV